MPPPRREAHRPSIQQPCAFCAVLMEQTKLMVNSTAVHKTLQATVFENKNLGTARTTLLGACAAEPSISEVLQLR